MGRELSSVEQALVDHVRSGERFDLFAIAQAEGWTPERVTVRAEVIRDILRGELVQRHDPLGLQVHGALIPGVLHLERIQSVMPCELVDCTMVAADISYASFPYLSMRGCQFGPVNGPALFADGVRIEQLLFLSAIEVEAENLRGAVRLAGAEIHNQLILSAAKIQNSSGPAISAGGVSVGGDLFMTDAECVGYGEDGTVDLRGAKFGGQLVLSSSRLSNSDGPALNAYAVEARDLLLNRLAASTSTGYGAVLLSGARVTDHVGLSKAVLSAERACALDADGLLAGGEVHMNRLSANGAGTAAVSFRGAKVGSMTINESRVRSTEGTALDANLMEVDGNFWVGGLEAATTGGDPALIVDDAHIGGRMILMRTTLRSAGGPALRGNRLRVGQELALGKLDAAGEAADGVVQLNQTQVSGDFMLTEARISTEAPTSSYSVDGLTYSGYPRTPDGHQGWLELLRHQTPAYAAQPYQQLAAAARASGHDKDVRTILMAQRRDQLARASTTRAERAWGALTGFTLGYGYQPWRALLLLLATAGTATVLFLLLGNNGGLAHIQGTGSDDCSAIDTFLLAIDASVPILDTGASSTCVVTDSASGDWLKAAALATQASGWGFATLFVAGFTSAVRK